MNRRSDRGIFEDGTPIPAVELWCDAHPPASGVAHSTTPLGDLVREVGRAFARRVATPPLGGAVLRWAAAWATYLALVVMLVGVARAHPAPAVATWLFVLTVEASHPVEPERRAAHVAWILVLLLGPAVLIAAAYPDVARHAWNAAVVLLAACALDRRPLARGVCWAYMLATWAALLLAAVVAWLALTNAGLRALHLTLAALDPRAHMLVAVIIQATAGAVAAVAMWCALRVHRWREGDRR